MSIGGRYERIEIDLTAKNLADAAFDTLLVLPTNGFDDLQVERSTILGARIGALGPSGNAPSVEPMVVEIASQDVPEFVSRLTNDAIDFTVFGSEVPQHKPHRAEYRWTTEDDIAYVPAPDPFGAQPWDTSQVYTLNLSYPSADDVPQAFTSFTTGTDVLYLAEPIDGPLLAIPVGFASLRADTITVSTPTRRGNPTEVEVSGFLSSSSDLVDLYESVSLCAMGAFDPYARYVQRAISSDRARTQGSGDPTFVMDAQGAWTVRNLRAEATSQGGGDPPLGDTIANYYQNFNEKETCDSFMTSGFSGNLKIKPKISYRIKKNEPNALVAGFETEFGMAMSGFAREPSSGLGVCSEAKFDLQAACMPLATLPGPVPLQIELRYQPTAVSYGRARLGTKLGGGLKGKAKVEAECYKPAGEPFRCDVDSTFPKLVKDPKTAIQLVSPAAIDIKVGVGAELDLAFGEPSTGTCSPLVKSKIGIEVEAGVRAQVANDPSGIVAWPPPIDPWWDLKAEAAVRGRAEIEMLNWVIPGIEFGEWKIESEPLDSADSPIPPDPTTNARFMQGEDQRWGVAIESANQGNTADVVTDVAVAPDGSVVVAAQTARLMKLDAFGEMLWNVGYWFGRNPLAVHVLPDGTIVTGGLPNYVAVHEPDGSVRFAKDVRVGGSPHASIRDVEPIVQPNGDWDLAVAGQLAGVGHVMRLDDQGNLVWATSYGNSYAMAFNDIAVSANGDLLVAGQSQDCDVPGGWCGLVMRLDASTGDIRWARVFRSAPRIGSYINEIIESPGGMIYGVGQLPRVLLDSGSAWIFTMNPNGGTVNQVVLTNDLDLEDALTFETAPVVEAADGSHDTLYGIDFVGDDIVVAGYAGYANTAWLAQLTSSLGPRWLMAMDGYQHDLFSSVDVAEDGIFVGGRSASVVENGVVNQERYATVFKVPFGGGFDLHDDFSNVVLRYAAPSVRGVEQDLDGPVLVEDVSVTTASPSVTITDFTSTALAPGFSECTHLLTETGHVTTTDTCSDPDRFFPVVRINQPIHGKVYTATERVPLSIVLHDEMGLSTSDVAVDGVSVAPDTVLQMSVLGVGKHTVYAFAEDSSGNIAQDEVRFEVVAP